MDSTNSLSYLLQHTSTIMHRQADQVLQEQLGIGMAQFRILMALQERSPVQQRFLAETLGQTEASISRQMKLLTDKGLVSIEVNPENRREHITLPTAKGLRLTHAAQDILADYHLPAFEQLSTKEKQQLTELLGHVHMYYCQEGRPYACDLPWFRHTLRQ